jgi:hypothetical protein
MTSVENLGLLLDLGQLVSDVRMIGWKFSESNKDLLGALPVVLLRKEAGGLGTEKDAD